MSSEAVSLIRKWSLLQVVIADDGISVSAKNLFAVLLNCYNCKTGQCNPKAETLGRLSALKRTRVLEVLKELEQRGLIAQARHGRLGSFYSINFGYEATAEKVRKSEPFTGPEKVRKSGLKRSGKADLVYRNREGSRERTPQPPRAGGVLLPAVVLGANGSGDCDGLPAEGRRPPSPPSVETSPHPEPTAPVPGEKGLPGIHVSIANPKTEEHTMGVIPANERIPAAVVEQILDWHRQGLTKLQIINRLPRYSLTISNLCDIIAAHGEDRRYEPPPHLEAAE